MATEFFNQEVKNELADEEIVEVPDFPDELIRSSKKPKISEQLVLPEYSEITDTVLQSSQVLTCLVSFPESKKCSGIPWNESYLNIFINFAGRYYYFVTDMTTDPSGMYIEFH